MLHHKKLMGKAGATLAVGMLTLTLACGQGAEPTPSPTPTLVPMNAYQVNVVMAECTGLIHDDVARVDFEKLNELAEVVGLHPVEETKADLDKYLPLLGHAISVSSIETRHWVQENCLDYINQ